MSTAPSTARLSPDDPSFPADLRALPERRLAPPGPLHVRGAWPPRDGIAVVGTRSPSDEALSFTKDLAEAAVAAGWAVWSGGAHGIDAAAHEAALAAGGRTVVVCPSGLDRPYPKEHADLFARVLESGGTLLTLRPDDAPPTLHAFHHRNAVLAALTFATIVVEAPLRSGARSTARAARALDRPLYVVPHSPWNERGAGCALELQHRALALADAGSMVRILGRDLAAWGDRPAGQAAIPRRGSALPRREVAGAPAGVQEVLAIDLDPSHARDPASARPGLARTSALQDMGDDARRVFEAIGQTPIHADDLCERTALGPGVVAAALLTLTLGAVVVEAPAGFYRRTSPP